MIAIDRGQLETGRYNFWGITHYSLTVEPLIIVRPIVWQQMRVSGRVVDDSDMPYLNSARKCGKDYENCQVM